MSGKGCRTFEDLRGSEFDWELFLNDVSSVLSVDWRRIDVAADDISGVLTFDKVDKAYRSGKVAGKLRSFRCMYGDEECFYAGSAKSSCLIRIYNKAKERGFKDGLVDGHPWTRCEMQLRDSAAGQLISEWLASGDLQCVFAGHLIEELRFTSKSNDKKNSQRLSVAKWWSGFV